MSASRWLLRVWSAGVCLTAVQPLRRFWKQCHQYVVLHFGFQACHSYSKTVSLKSSSETFNLFFKKRQISYCCWLENPLGLLTMWQKGTAVFLMSWDVWSYWVSFKTIISNFMVKRGRIFSFRTFWLSSIGTAASVCGLTRCRERHFIPKQLFMLQH